MKNYKKRRVRRGEVKVVEGINHKKLIVDGKVQLITGENIPETIFVSDINLLNDKKLNVLCVGLGGGYTLTEILKHSNVIHVDVVEIYNSVIYSLKKFETYDIIKKDNRVNIINKNIVKYLQKSEKKYDLIVIDLCHPELESSKNIYEEKFFLDLKSVLTDDGLILKWFYNNGYIQTTGKHIYNKIKNICKGIFNVCKSKVVEETIYFFITDNIMLKSKNRNYE